MTRFPYIILTFAYQLMVIPALAERQSLWLLILSIPLYLVFVAVPRARSCKWPSWIAWVSVIPLIGTVPSVALFWAAPKSSLFNPEDGNPDLPSDKVPDFTETRMTKCSECDKSIIIPLEGAMINGQVICFSCRKSLTQLQKTERPQA